MFIHAFISANLWSFNNTTTLIPLHTLCMGSPGLHIKQPQEKCQCNSNSFFKKLQHSQRRSSRPKQTNVQIFEKIDRKTFVLYDPVCWVCLCMCVSMKKGWFWASCHFLHFYFSRCSIPIKIESVMHILLFCKPGYTWTKISRIIIKQLPVTPPLIRLAQVDSTW